MKAIVKTANRVRTKEREEKRMTNAAAASAIAAAP
jgi:hypothetical protein